MLKIINDMFLNVKTEDRNFFQIILWWELRRILYNAITLVCGLVSLTLIFYFAEVELEPGEDLIEPLGLIFFGLLCNLCYSLGWITELFTPKSTTYGPKMFKIGLCFTLFWVFLPAVIHIIFWIGRMV
jgi:hypothetical protein